jgi:hypothetical protein
MLREYLPDIKESIFIKVSDKCSIWPSYYDSGNRGHPASINPQFKAGDPRLKYVVNELDPRIHFALVCGAKVSCSDC